MTINARALEHAIRKMLSHPLAEVRQLGEEIKQVAQKEVPTLVKYAEAVQYLQFSQAELENEARGIAASKAPPKIGAVWFITNQKVKTSDGSALFRQGDLSYTQALDYVRSLDAGGQQRLAMTLLGAAGKFDIPLRELEHAHLRWK